MFTNTAGFVIGFILGGITGYFGNWLWYRFGPIRNKPHLTMTTQEGSVSFSGVGTEENRGMILKSLKAAFSETKKPQILPIPDRSSDPDSNIS
jgi:hypothetical protein